MNFGGMDQSFYVNHRRRTTWPKKAQTTPMNRFEEEVEEKTITLTAVVNEVECALLYQSDNLSKILRLTAYWLRLRNRLIKFCQLQLNF